MDLRIFTKTLLLTLLFIIPISSYPLKAGSGFELTPASIDLTLRTEQSHLGTFTIINNEDTDVLITLQEGMYVDGQIVKEDFSWITTSPQQFALKKSQSQEIQYTLTVPSDTPKGVYNKLILLNIAANTATREQNNYPTIDLTIPYQINIFVDSLFASDLGIKVTEFSSDTKLTINNQITFKIKVENKGKNQISKPIGHLRIISSMGDAVYSAVLNESLKAVTDSDTFEYDFTANYPINNIIDIGQYRAELLFTDSLSGSTELKQMTFVSINYLLFVIIIGVITAIFFLTGTIKGLLLETSSIKIAEDQKYIGIQKETRIRSAK